MNRLLILGLVMGSHWRRNAEGTEQSSERGPWKGLQEHKRLFHPGRGKDAGGGLWVSSHRHVRSFAQQVAHVADDQYNLCAPAKGETRKAAYTEIENTLSKKTTLVDALKKAFAYCDGAYEALTDVSGVRPSICNSSRTRFCHVELEFVAYLGTLRKRVVYLRMKGLVPPTSEMKPDEIDSRSSGELE